MKGFYLDREKILAKFRVVAEEALKRFEEIEEIRIFGSFSRKEETGLSDIDILIILNRAQKENPVERIKPYFCFFADRMKMAIDILALEIGELERFERMLKESILIVKRAQSV